MGSLVDTLLTMKVPVFFKRSEKLSEKYSLMLDPSTKQLIAEAEKVLNVPETIRHLIRDYLPRAVEMAKNKGSSDIHPTEIR